MQAEVGEAALDSWKLGVEDSGENKSSGRRELAHDARSVSKKEIGTQICTDHIKPRPRSLRHSSDVLLTDQYTVSDAIATRVGGGDTDSNGIGVDRLDGSIA
jgi:phage baseplate assembly protein gpV